VYTVFLSHISSDADFVDDVGTSLVAHGIAGFVARRDIPKAARWADVLETALLQCDALAAFLRREFRSSEWTDQEVGFALGRQKAVIPLRLERACRPHGFLSRYQAVEIEGAAPADVAAVIFDTLYAKAEEQRNLVPIVLERLLNERRHKMLSLWVHRAVFLPIDDPSVEQALKTTLRTNSIIKTDRRLRAPLEQILEGV
jgi:hypothetical protein